MESILGRYKVLIVDDEPNIADTLAKIFAHAGYESHAVYSAEEALDLIPGWTPRLAIIDVCLPRMNGIDLAILLQAEYPECYCTLFSGQSVTGDLLDGARELGYDMEVLAKPVQPADLLGLASRLLGPSEGDA